MTTAPIHALTTAKRRRLIAIGLLRASAATAALVAAYYLLPLDHLAGAPLGVSLVAGLLALTAMTVYQVRAILGFSRSKHLILPSRWDRMHRAQDVDVDRSRGDLPRLGRVPGVPGDRPPVGA